MVEVPSWSVHNLPYFNSIQDSPNEFEWIGLAQNNNNIMNFIFGHFALMIWWKVKAREAFTPCPL